MCGEDVWCVCVVGVSVVCVCVCVCVQCPGVLGKGKSWPWILGLQRAPRTSLVTHFFNKNKSLIITHNITQNVPFHSYSQHNSPVPHYKPALTCRIRGPCLQLCLCNFSCLRAP